MSTTNNQAPKTNNQAPNNQTPNNQTPNNKAKTIQKLWEALDTIQKDPEPNWKHMVQVQTQLIKMLSQTIQEQKKAMREISNRVKKIEEQGNTIPVQDMKKVANILQPFLAKTYKNNKNNKKTLPVV